MSNGEVAPFFNGHKQKCVGGRGAEEGGEESLFITITKEKYP